tara:strand:+ start:188 stop:1231 length:1044 start_codon:yes stop_codon:yes gene_type:complete
MGIGISSEEGPTHFSKEYQNLTIKSLKIISKKFNLFGKKIKHLLIFFELSIRVILCVTKLKPSVIHCHDNMVLPLGILLKFIFKSRLIYDAHELESNRNGIGRIEGAMVFYFEKMVWKSIDLFISVSPSIIDWYQSKFGTKKNLLILNTPYFELDGVSESKSINYFRNKFHLDKDTKVFVYLGAIGAGRGIKKILETFSSKEVDAAVVFIGWGEHEKYVKKYSETNQNIFLHKPVSHEKVVEIVSQADYGLALIEDVSLSDYLCLPNKLFEYLFAGIPVLSSDFPEIKNLLNELDAGIVTELNPTAIIKSIKEIENKKFEIDSDKLKNYSWESQSKKLISAYKELLC